MHSQLASFLKYNFVFTRRKQQPDEFVFSSVWNENRTRILTPRISDFVSFVENVLNHSISSKIKKFELDGRQLFSYLPQIRQWLSFAVEREVEDVVFLSYDFSYVSVLPESFRTCSSLMTLHLRCHRFDDPGHSVEVSKEPKAGVCDLNDDQILNLLSGCPSLETMELYDVGGFRRLETNSLNFKRLNLKNHRVPEVDSDIDVDNENVNDPSLEIFAPYLEHLEISGNLDNLKCRLVDVSSLVNARLTFYISCIKHVRHDHGDDIGVDEYSCHDYHQGPVHVAVQRIAGSRVEM
ncbi:putative F-box/LRR-repeat protein At3g18150 isoform X2 [Capsicum annuum]|uniref:putative F-box/LRR-repeat protein At3g18150 isoform X2 n=2 Tax=Capsicum annuum TaxID=4072 RepID=UPI0007BF1871|nr:putative F-box/LRR-repeat protein At3g18150 isoform X2 [Capsicum annuum]